MALDLLTPDFPGRGVVGFLSSVRLLQHEREHVEAGPWIGEQYKYTFIYTFAFSMCSVYAFSTDVPTSYG
jgi:hypothetical protein